jgi:type II secretory pathway pseudopilin PulG
MELLIAVLSAAVALTSVAMSSRASRRQAKLAAELDRLSAERQRALARQDIMSKHRDQLLWAAFDLQSRVYDFGRWFGTHSGGKFGSQSVCESIDGR